jgi:taurine dioxygenase
MRITATGVACYNRISVTPVTGSIGAEVEQVDLRDLDDEIIAELHDAWMEHKVLFFRDQELDRAQHVAYGRAFGELEIHPFTPQADGHPEILVLESTPEKFQAAESWHSDVTFRECPPDGSVLLGRIVPEWGGDTVWANMEMAYERLPDDTKERIRGRYAVHSYVKAFGRVMTDEQRSKALEEFPDQKHPIVRTHPVTGKKGLFINRVFTLTIDGMTPEESRPLRRRLYEQASLPELQVRFRWRPGSLAQWDNRITQHYAVPDHGGQIRRMERVTLVGERPF